MLLFLCFRNILEDPIEDTYRRIRITSSRFKHQVWQYNNAQFFFLSCGWMEVCKPATRHSIFYVIPLLFFEIDDYLVLPMEQSLDLALGVIDRHREYVL